MKIIVKGSFDRDLDKVRDRELRLTLNKKIDQIEKAKSFSQVTGAKLLEGYSRHYRILVKSSGLSYRIGAIVRGDTMWFVRFLPRKKVYKSFP